MARLLVVTDDPAIRELLSTSLQGLGHTVDATPTDTSALTSVMLHVPDIIVYALPKIVRAEWSFLEHLRVKMQRTQLPVIAILDAPDPNSTKWARDLLVSDVISRAGKTPADLLAVLQQSIEKTLC